MTRILVGVDASPTSVEALRRAAEETRWRGDATLEVVYVYALPEPIAGFPVPVERGEDTVDEQAELDKARERLRSWLDETGVDLSDVDVEWTVIADRRPVSALVERSRDADLLVVGSRGTGGFKGLRLGSVSEQVTRHAECPVLVVR
jgi:nucleotide-binding universal stress UspA family protein